MLVQVRGLGRGKGVEVVKTYSLLDGSDPDLLDLISNRVAVIYDLLYEDIEPDEAEEEEAEGEEEEEESLSELEKELRMGEAEDEEEGDISDLDEEIIE